MKTKVIVHPGFERLEIVELTEEGRKFKFLEAIDINDPRVNYFFKYCLFRRKINSLCTHRKITKILYLV